MILAGRCHGAVALLVCALCQDVTAQQVVRDTSTGLIWGTKESVAVTVTHGRPPAADREVLGNIVPYDVPWITGAGEPADLSTLRPILIGRTRIEPGNYSLWTLPARTGVLLIVNRGRDTRYDATDDVARIPMQVDSLPVPIGELSVVIHNDRHAPDTLSIQYDKGQSAREHIQHYTIDLRSGTGQVLLIIWGRFQWSVPIGVPD